jgi:hypothetical protein
MARLCLLVQTEIGNSKILEKNSKSYLLVFMGILAVAVEVRSQNPRHALSATDR